MNTSRGFPSSKTAVFVSFVVASIILAGCATMTSPRSAPLPASPAQMVDLPKPTVSQASAAPAIPLYLLQEGVSISLSQIIDLALANSPVTRTSWLQARAAAALVGSKQAPFLPTVDLTATGLRAKQSGMGEEANLFSTYGPAANLNFMLLDFGGRGANLNDARQALIAADFAHNATVQNVVFNVQQAYYLYLNAKAQLEAARVTLKQAETALSAANGRHDAGVATIAEVLQAKTAYSQAMLNYEGADGQVMTIRGVLATAIGLPATIPLDVGSLPGDVPIDKTWDSIQDLIGKALAERPDLNASRALAEKAAVHVKAVKSEGLPILSLSAGVNRTFYNPHPYESSRNNWSGRLLLTFPLFTGFANSYNIEKAKQEAAAAAAQAQTFEQQVILGVWTSYYALQTATQRVRTSRDLLASAEQSEKVAMGRYKEGVGTILDVLLAQSALASARSQEIQARSDWFTAVARLARDTGAAAPLFDATMTTEKR